MADSATMTPWELRLLQLTAALRTQLLESVEESDLAFALPGNPPLGDLCVANGQMQRSYIDSFRTRRQDWTLAPVDAGLGRSVSALRSWWAELDAELEAVLLAIPASEFDTGQVEREPGFSMPIRSQYHTWREAILIFCGHADVYLLALGRPRAEQWRHWIG